MTYLRVFSLALLWACGWACGSGHTTTSAGDPTPTDPANGDPGSPPGTPGNDGGGVTVGTGTCSTCVVLADGQDYARDIAVDATHVYWTVANEGAVRKAGLEGGTVDLATSQNAPMGIALVQSTLFWTTQGTSPGFTDGAVKKIPMTGGNPETLADNQVQAAHLMATSTNLFWVNQGTPPGLTGGSVVRAALDGSGATPLASDLTNANFVVADDQYAYFTLAGTAPNYTDGSVMRVPVTGGHPEALASNEPSPWGIAVDATHLYWTDAVPNGNVMMMPKGGGKPPSVLTPGGKRPNCIFLDGSNVYFSDYDGGAVMRVAKTGGTATTLAAGMKGPESIVTDATHVYWTNRGTGNSDGSVVKLAK